LNICGPGSSVGIATGYGLDGPGIESRWRRDFPPVQTGPGARLASCAMGTGCFPAVNCGRGVLLTTNPILVPRSWKSRAIPLYPPSGPHRICKGITLPLPFFTVEYSHVGKVDFCFKGNPCIVPISIFIYRCHSFPVKTTWMGV